MRKVLLGALVLGLLGALACVGDDPTPGNAANDGGGGGVEGGTPPTTPPGTPPGPPPPPPPSGNDAAADAGPCDLTKDFADPKPLTELNSASNEFGATLTQDELQIVFTSAVTNPAPAQQDDDQDLWFSSRTSTGQTFGTPTKTNIIGLNVNTMDIDCTLSPSGKVLLWTQKDPAVGGTYRMRYAVRSTAGDPFGTPNDVTVTGGASLGGAYARGTFQTQDALYFGMIKQGDGAHTIYRAPIVVPGQIDAPVQQKLGGGEAIPGTTPVVTADELTLYVGAHLFPTLTPGDILVYTRASKNDPWGTAKSLAIDTPAAAEEPRWISPDGCRLYYSSDIAGGSGKADLYVATRPK